MAAIAAVPTPSPTRSFVHAIGSGAGRDAIAALTVAWHLATQRDQPIGPRVRAQSFALVLAVASVLGTGSLVAASAARVILPHVDRTEILEPRGSIILEPAPVRIAPTSPGRSDPAPVTVPVSESVSVAVSKEPPVSTRMQTRPASDTKRSDDGGATEQGAEADPGDAGPPASGDGGDVRESEHEDGSGASPDDGSDGGDSGPEGGDHEATGDDHEGDGGTPGD
jgi:hypothetical protein